MSTMRLHHKFLLLVIPVVLAWTQYVTAEHEWADHAAIDDCVICKIAENGSDKASLVDFTHIVYLSFENVVVEFSEIILYTKLSDTSLSRAPPVS